MAERPARRMVVAAGLITLAAGCVTGCTGVTTISDSAGACPWTTQPPAPPGTAQSDIVILIDISASFWPKTGQTVQQQQDGVRHPAEGIAQLEHPETVD